MTAAALDGIRVIDLSTDVAGPYCTKLLSGLGANVIKLEPPEGDPSRRKGPFPNDSPHHEKSGAFLHLNTGKLGVTLSLEQRTGREILKRLANNADVLVESFSPGHMDDLGLGYDDLASLNPGLIVVSITPFGQDGPYRDFQATEIVTYALSGYMSLTGDPDREPLKAYGEQSELQAGLQAALATATALFARRETWEGQHVDVSITEAATFLLGGAPQTYYHRGTLLRRNGARLIGMAPQTSYPSTLRPCKGGYVHAHGNIRHPDLLAALMQEPELASDEILSAPMGNADRIDELMDPWLSHHDKWEVVRLAQELRLPFTEVMTSGEVLQDEHHRASAFWAKIDHPAAGPVTQPGPPIRMPGTPWTTGRAPLLGEHNSQVYGDLLGYSDQEIVELRAAGII